ncbi:Maf family nucleotide pyrophosphatase [Methylophilaceae bacterium]|nr:Maf family nucleotide pyrophosphatase [Methylophilaceae bacterium]
MKNIILASSSVYRKELLERLIPSFTIVSPSVDESTTEGESAKDSAQRIAGLKARKVSKDHKESYVIGSDQTAEFKGQQIRKPTNYEEAYSQLIKLSGQTVLFHSAVCVINEANHHQLQAIETIEVKYRKFEASEAETYLRHEEVIGCLGCIKSEGLGISMLEYVKSSDPTAIIGMPLIGLSNILKKLDIDFHGQ